MQAHTNTHTHTHTHTRARRARARAYIHVSTLTTVHRARPSLYNAHARTSENPNQDDMSEGPCRWKSPSVALSCSQLMSTRKIAAVLDRGFMLRATIVHTMPTTNTTATRVATMFAHCGQHSEQVLAPVLAWSCVHSVQSGPCQHITPTRSTPRVHSHNRSHSHSCNSNSNSGRDGTRKPKPTHRHHHDTPRIQWRRTCSGTCSIPRRHQG